jgi:hypothetical protein
MAESWLRASSTGALHTRQIALSLLPLMTVVSCGAANTMETRQEAAVPFPEPMCSLSQLFDDVTPGCARRRDARWGCVDNSIGTHRWMCQRIRRGRRWSSRRWWRRRRWRPMGDGDRRWWCREGGGDRASQKRNRTGDRARTSAYPHPNAAHSRRDSHVVISSA